MLNSCNSQHTTVMEWVVDTTNLNDGFVDDWTGRYETNRSDHMWHRWMWRRWRRLSENGPSLLHDEPWPWRCAAPRIHSLRCNSPPSKQTCHRPEFPTLYDRCCMTWNVKYTPILAIISETEKATDFEFGCYIHRVHPNISPLQILEKGEQRWVYPGLPKFLSTRY